MYYVLSVGTNIGDRKKNIDDCIEALNLVPKTSVVSSSAIYKTAPVGYDKQDDFYNACLLVASDFEPGEMLGVCMGVEAGFGRKRAEKNGPRILDIDIIFAENKKIDTKNLIIPHPRFSKRRFVLLPMLDIFTDGVVFGVDIKEILEKIDDENQKVDKINS